MLFATNRRSQQDPTHSLGLRFDVQDTLPSEGMTFCKRVEAERYHQLSNQEFFQSLAEAEQQHILLYIHGFNNTGEEEIFPHSTLMQKLFDEVEQAPDVLVVPLIWPCDDDALILLMEDYFDDAEAADKSHLAFAQLFEEFYQWLQEIGVQGVSKQLHLLAHSMGNRVLSNAIKTKFEGLEECPPKLFQNVFMVAADMVNLAFEKGYRAEYLPYVTNNLVVYHAKDDLALAASQGVNLLTDGWHHRLGQKGPSNPDWLPEHVYIVDCNEINFDYDLKVLPLIPDGHEYYLSNKEKTQPSPVFLHYARAIAEGEVSPATRHYCFP